MGFNDKLAAARIKRGLSQEQVAGSMGVSRQAVSKWESGESLPDIDNLVKLSGLLVVSIDRLLKDDGCASQSGGAAENNSASPKSREVSRSGNKDIISFLLGAKKNTYAAHAAEQAPSRPCSHDLKYAEGKYVYIDTYLGEEKFSGEEAVWFEAKPVWAMNYSGRVLTQRFSGGFLSEALMHVPEDHPYRGPLTHKNGDYSYHCIVNGGFEWFRGYEEIFCGNEKTYECYFHGGEVR